MGSPRAHFVSKLGSTKGLTKQDTHKAKFIEKLIHSGLCKWKSRKINF